MKTYTLSRTAPESHLIKKYINLRMATGGPMRAEAVGLQNEKSYQGLEDYEKKPVISR